MVTPAHLPLQVLLLPWLGARCSGLGAGLTLVWASPLRPRSGFSSSWLCRAGRAPCLLWPPLRSSCRAVPTAGLQGRQAHFQRRLAGHFHWASLSVGCPSLEVLMVGTSSLGDTGQRPASR